MCFVRHDFALLGLPLRVASERKQKLVSVGSASKREDTHLELPLGVLDAIRRADLRLDCVDEGLGFTTEGSVY